MKLISLFAGIGGFDLAFARQGFDSVAQCEIDPNCQKLLRAKWPSAVLHGDIKTFDESSLESPSVVVFGSPCQDLSCAGQRQGINGERSGLFFYAIRIIQRLARRGLQFALWENVPGVFSSNGGRDFAAVLSAMANIGALDVGWVTLDAQWFGLAQRRRRVFLVADFGGRRCDEILSLSEGLSGHPAPRRETRERIAPTIEGRAGRSGSNNFATSGGLAEVSATLSGEMLRRHATGSNPIAGAMVLMTTNRQDLDNDTFVPIRARRLRARANSSHREDSETFVLAHGQGNAEMCRDGSPSLTCNHEAPICFSSKDSGNDAAEELAPTLRSQNFKDSHMNGGGQAAIAFTERTRADGRNFEAQEELAYALTNPGSGGRTHSRSIATAMQIRRLTPLECERLQGFPDGWTAGFIDSVRYRMIGNSVAVPVVEWIARRMAIALTP